MKTPSPESLLVKRVNWDYFLTLTHKPDDYVFTTLYTDGVISVEKNGTWWEQPTFQDQLARLWRWHKRCVKYLKLKPREFLTANRWEVGKGGREHFHALVKILDPIKRTRATMYTIRHIWAEELNYGFSAVRRSDVMANDYITKILSEYEESRFEDSRQRHVFFNHAALGYLRRQCDQPDLVAC